jgi:hypothetical protein
MSEGRKAQCSLASMEPRTLSLKLACIDINTTVNHETGIHDVTNSLQDQFLGIRTENRYEGTQTLRPCFASFSSLVRYC